MEAEGLGEGELGGAVFHTRQEFFQGIEFHMGADIAGAAVAGGGAEEVFGGGGLAHLVQNTGLRHHNKLTLTPFADTLQHLRRRADEVRVRQHRLLALGVGHHESLGVVVLQLDEVFFVEHFMDDAAAGPQKHVASGLLGDIVAQMPVRRKEDAAARWNAVDNFDGIGAGANDVAEGFDRGRRIDIGNDEAVLMLCFEGRKSFGRATVRQGATGVEVRQQNQLFRVEDFGRFRHEVHAAKDDDVRLCLSSLLSERQAVAHKVRAVLYFALLIIVRQDNRIQLAFQLFNLVFNMHSHTGKGL